MSGLYYPTTRPQVLIGSKASDTNTRTSIEMESTYQAESATEATKSFEVGGFSKVALAVLYTMGASETSNTLEMKLEESPDRTNWYQLTTDTTSGATSTLALREWTIAGANGTTQGHTVFVDIGYKYMRVSFKETGVASNKGSVYCEATLLGK